MKISVKELVEEAVLDPHPSTNGWYRVNCPICVIRTGKDDTRWSLGFKPEWQWFKCNRCAVQGHLDGTYEELIDANPIIDGAEEQGPVEADEAPESFTLLAEGSARTSRSTLAAREYLAYRNVSQEIIKSMQIGICLEGDHRNRIIIPVFDSEGAWKGWIGRTWEDSFLNYRYPSGMKRGSVLFNEQALLVETDEPAIIVEGGFDALPHCPNAVACMGKPSAKQWPILKRAKRPVIVALDGDSWREGKAMAMKLKLHGIQSGYLKLAPKTDPGNLMPGVLLERAKNLLQDHAA